MAGLLDWVLGDVPLIKIRWLNSDRSRAKISRGFLFWRRTATVNKIDYCWRFERTNAPVSELISRRLEEKRKLASERDNWDAVAIPMARVICAPRREDP